MKQLILLLVIISSTLFGMDFKDNAFKLNLKYDETIWEIQPTEKYRQRLILKHINLPVTVNVLAYRFAETITANGLVQRRIQSVYDGWQLLSEEDILGIQSKALNITEGKRSIYRKAVLEETLGQVHYFAGDICFVTDDTLAIVLNIEVKGANNLIRVKDEFNQIYTSFWYGDQKPLLNYVINSSDSWVNQHQNLARRRFVESTFQFNDQTSIDRKVSIGKDIKFKSPEFFSNSNGDYILDGKRLIHLAPNSDLVNTFNFDLVNPKLQLTNDGIVAFQFQPSIHVQKFNLDFKLKAQFQEDTRAIDAFYVNNSIVLLTNEGLRLVTDSVEVWRLDLPIKNMVYAVDLEYLFIAQNNQQTLSKINLNSGTIEQSKTFEELSNAVKGRVTDLAINQDKVLVVLEEGKDVILSIFNAEDFALEDQVTKNVTQFKIVGVSDNLLMVSYNNENNESIIEALDFNTFASAWQQSYDSNSPIITKGQLFYVDNNKELVSLNLKSEDPVVNIAAQDLLMQQTSPSEDVTTTVSGEFIKVFPKKSTLMTLISHENESKVIYLR